MKVILSSRARHDLEGIQNYIEQDNPARAMPFVNEVRRIMKHLNDMNDADDLARAAKSTHHEPLCLRFPWQAIVRR